MLGCALFTVRWGVWCMLQCMLTRPTFQHLTNGQCQLRCCRRHVHACMWGGGADSTKEWWEHWQGARRANHLNLYDVLFVMCVMCAQLKEDVLQRAATA